MARAPLLLAALLSASLAAAAELRGSSGSEGAAQQRSHQVLRNRIRVHRNKPKDAGWFGDFDQMESTYTAEGTDAYLDQNPTRNVQMGWEFGYKYPLSETKIKSGEWFDESPSAGELDAWQTHYPSVSGSLGGNKYVRNNPWRYTPEGWVQDYNPSYLTSKRKSDPGRYPAQWFDSAVENFDGFGRRPLPYPDTARRALQDGAVWEERAVNTTIECAEIGCTANASLTAFDANTEEARNCRLNIGVHPTDFDDDWGREKIDQWVVNGFLVKGLCDPHARGCNASASRPLYSCLSEFGVDHIIDSNGTMAISGKINHMVDECPYNGNLLSAVAMVTCLVRPIPPPPNQTQPELQEAATQPQVKTLALGNATLHCSAPGCSATTIVNVDPSFAMLGGSCLMNITVAQTDFDDNLGLPEQIDYIILAGGPGNLTLSQPTRNPCNMEYEGTTPTEEDRTHMVVTGFNVTEALLASPAGSLRFEGKISDQVDECASNGKLFDAVIKVRCELPADVAASIQVSTNATDADATTAAA